mmetsp:Transcript_107022/g.301104  ORF Transcript_107022/g.301104 Transcript_107022/m.301104 type:complete len:210 (+) Transcript_107022:431-1060(+)
MRILLPLLALVGPGPVPLPRAPRVADLHEAEVLVGVPLLSHGSHLKQRERMRCHEALRLPGLLHAATAEHGAIAVVVSQEREKLIRGVPLVRRLEATSALVHAVVQGHEVLSHPRLRAVDLVAPGVATGHGTNAPLCDASLDAGIAATELRKGLLQDHGPNFASVGLRVAYCWHPVPVAPDAIRCSGVSRARHVVVNDHVAPALVLHVV